MAKRQRFITTDDAVRLEELIETDRARNWHDRENLDALRQDLALATIVEPDAIDPDVVTLHTTVRIGLPDDTDSEFTLVFPDETEIVYGGISVLAPLGLAILGCRAGDTVRFRTPGGRRTIRIEEVLYQPQAAGKLVAS